MTVELVPSTCWCTNVRSHAAKAVWDRLRRQVAAEAAHRCEICRAGDGEGPSRSVSPPRRGGDSGANRQEGWAPELSLARSPLGVANSAYVDVTVLTAKDE